MRTRVLTALVAAGAVGLVACGDRVEMPLGLALSGPTQGGVFIQVSDTAGTATPVFLWSGPNARELTVIRVSDGFLMWRVEAVDAEGGFAGPVQHSATPSGSRVTQTPTLLTDSVEYTVRIITVNGIEGRLRFRS